MIVYYLVKEKNSVYNKMKKIEVEIFYIKMSKAYQ